MTVRFRVADDVELAADIEGPWAGPPVLLLHGGGQTRHAWKGTGSVLAEEGFLSVAADLRGHGESDWAPDADYSLDAYAADVTALVEALRCPAALVGASLGGLASLLALGETPGLACRALVLVDVTPQTSADGRERIGEFMRANPGGFASIVEAADAVSRYLPHRPRPADISGLTKNLRQQEDGRFYWHWDPRFLEGRLGPTVNDARARLDRATATVPLLLVRGTDSEVISEDDATAFRSVAPPHRARRGAPGAAHGRRRPQRPVHPQRGRVPHPPPRPTVTRRARRRGQPAGSCSLRRTRSHSCPPRAWSVWATWSIQLP